MDYEPILPLRAIAFQILFLLVAISIEAGLYRQQLRLGFQQSVQYATVINLASVVAGWIGFLVVEPLSPPDLKSQIISYVLFNRLLFNGWSARVGFILLIAGLAAFFITYFIKLKGLEFILRAAGEWPETEKSQKSRRDQKYLRARQGRSDAQQAIARFADTVIQANAISFSIILLLLLLRAVAVEWS
ncbi:MAG: hypothetical protein DCF15_00830 [Phormidesmis priestleyi]|uniref:Filament integrity protein fraC n=1 Tax=Phormidesmis priestleyi TaxID=268141 RepID=A0A2W4XXC4_9CYAN|nr:MAG: hypothetical protein DCF15_00830 [Phormidesmis priestleyi]